MLTIRASQAVCPADPPNPDQAQLLPSGVSIRHVLQVIAIVSTTITGVLACGLIVMHLLSYRVPAEQRQIIRLVAVPLVYAVISLLQIYFYDAAEYLRPVADLYEAFALASLLMLFVHFTEPGYAERDQLKAQSTAYSPRFFRHVYILVFQYPVVRLITLIATEASLATGKYCSQSNNVQFAHIWVTIFQTISVVFAVGAILRFYFKVRPEMAGHNPGLKLLAFKLIIFLSFLQNLVFSILIGTGRLTVTTYASYYDITRGIPAVLICIECVLFSALNFVAFKSSEYSIGRLAHKESVDAHLQENPHGEARYNTTSLVSQKMSLTAAIFSALNPMDILEGFGNAVKILAGAN